MRLFHICTISNRLDEYEEMKASFISAGFNEEMCRYSLFDNSKGNVYEPYSTFNQIKSRTEEPYIIFCHQDIRIDQGHDFNHLLSNLEELEHIDPTWAVVGNAGYNDRYEAVVRITDLNRTPNYTGEFPQKVHSLDENFLVIKTSASVKCSSQLNGFHFYAPDLCLNTIKKGYSYYVTDFHIKHLSGGTLSSDFWRILSRFKEHWNSSFYYCHIKTMTGIDVFLSRNYLIRKIFSKASVINFIMRRKHLFIFLRQIRF